MTWRITEAQISRVRELARSSCCNCVDGNCLLLVSIPAPGNRQSGNLETAVPAFRKPVFRCLGNRCPAGACIRC